VRRYWRPHQAGWPTHSSQRLGACAGGRKKPPPAFIYLFLPAGYARQIEPIGVDIGTPDFIGLAKAFGAAAETLTKADELPKLLREAAQRKGPTLIEINETLYVKERG
jgi:hypothetical protein